MKSEQERIHLLHALFGASPSRRVHIGIGDDAAVIEPGPSKLVWTVDASVEGVHFRRDLLALEDVGWRSMMAATSDLAAMGARALGALSALVLPPGFADSDLEALARGQDDAARATGMSVIGGNLARGSELSITTTVLGEADAPLLRGGARPSDIIAVSGPLGLARAGLLALERGVAASSALEEAIHAWRRPLARMDAGLSAATMAHAAIDLSDGLSLDASRLAEASRVGVTIDADLLLAHGGPSLIEAAEALGEDPVDLALEGGEDYAILLACPQGHIPQGFRVIGHCKEERGLWLRDREGNEIALAARGFDHFR